VSGEEKKETPLVKNYEAFIILKPILDVDNSDNTLKAVEDTVENLKGKVVKKEKLGRKRLAYEIKKFKDGFITNYVLNMDPASIKEFQRICHLNEDILRLVIIDRSGIDLDQPLSTPRPEGRFGDRDRGDRPDRGPRMASGAERQ
jgi:small subunit ribosomal protein S6